MLLSSIEKGSLVLWQPVWELSLTSQEVEDCFFKSEVLTHMIFLKLKGRYHPTLILFGFILWQSNFNLLSNKAFLDTSSLKSLWPVSSAVFCQKLHGLFQSNFDKAGSYKKSSYFTCAPIFHKFSFTFGGIAVCLQFVNSLAKRPPLLFAYGCV